MSRRPSQHRRAMVMGGAGFLGSHVCESLLHGGYQVVCLDNECTGSDTNVAHLVGEDAFTYRQCDVTEGVDVPGPVDLVLQLASPASPVDCMRTTACSTVELNGGPSPTRRPLATDASVTPSSNRSTTRGST